MACRGNTVNSRKVGRMLMTWELGGGMGHAGRLSALAEGMGSSAQIFLALRDLAGSGSIVGRVRSTLLQAPLWLPEVRGLPDAASYPELLFRAGFLDPVRLESVARAWRSLFDLVQPDLLLVDHSPTALLAARGLRFRRASIGTGFFLPPPVAPLPAFREWENILKSRIEQSEAIALSVSNRVLDAIGAPPLERLADLLQADEHFLTTWPELDHYPERVPGTRYWGPEALLDAGLSACWPQGEQPRVFAYLSIEHPRTMEVLRILRAAPVRTLAYVTGIAPAVRAGLEAANLAISTESVRMDEARIGADLVVCHAGSGTVSAVLQSGKPIILLPLHAEQYLFGLRVAQTGAGVLLNADAVPKRLPRLLREMSGDSSYRQAALALARKHADCDIPGTLQRVCSRCEELLRGE